MKKNEKTTESIGSNIVYTKMHLTYGLGVDFIALYGKLVQERSNYTLSPITKHLGSRGVTVDDVTN